MLNFVHTVIIYYCLWHCLDVLNTKFEYKTTWYLNAQQLFG